MKPAELYILNQKNPYRDILLHLQAVIENKIPDLQLFFKWNIPFYYYKKKPFCYLNASPKKMFVDLAFMKGFQITVHQEQLVSENRTMVKSLRYKLLEEIDNKVLEEVLLEAIELMKH